MEIGKTLSPDEGMIGRKEMVDIARIANQLEISGFRNVSFSSEYFGVPFQLMAQGKDKRTYLFKIIKQLDSESIAGISHEFSTIYEKAMRPLFGKYFLFCIIADTIQQNGDMLLLERIHKETKKPEYLIKDTGSGWWILADSSKKKLYPRFLIDDILSVPTHNDLGRVVAILKENL